MKFLETVQSIIIKIRNDKIIDDDSFKCIFKAVIWLKHGQVLKFEQTIKNKIELKNIETYIIKTQNDKNVEKSEFSFE